MPDHREIVITGSEIESVEINRTKMQVKQGPNSTTWIVTLPDKDKLSDGPWPVVVVLPGGARKEFKYKYRKKEEGKSQIIIVTPRRPQVDDAIRSQGQPAPDNRRQSRNSTP
jgi:hypothetical protein